MLVSLKLMKPVVLNLKFSHFIIEIWLSFAQFQESWKWPSFPIFWCFTFTGSS